MGSDDEKDELDEYAWTECDDVLSAIDNDSIALLKDVLEASSCPAKLLVQPLQDGGRALHHAAAVGSVAVVVFLLERGVEVDAIAHTSGRSTALHWAATAGQAEAVKLLLAAGANPTVKTAEGASPAVLAASSGHAALATLLDAAARGWERNRRNGAPRKMGPGRGSWFWGCFAGAGRALNAAALYIWILNAFFASWLYITRLAPWVFGAVPSPRAAHFSLWVFYFLSWIFWVLAWWHDPGTVTGGAAREAYRIAVAAIAAGDAEEGLEGWLVHKLRIMIPPRAGYDSVTGSVILRFDHYCPFIANAVGLRNQAYFFLYVLTLTVACILFVGISVTQRLYGLPDDWVDAGLLDMATGIIAVGQLTYWQWRLFASNWTTHERDVVSRPGWWNRLYYFRSGEELRNPFDLGWRENSREFFLQRLSPWPPKNASQRVKEGSSPEFVFPVNHRAQAEAAAAAAMAAAAAARAARAAAAGLGGDFRAASAGAALSQGHGGDASRGDNATCFAPPSTAAHPLPPPQSSLATVRVDVGVSSVGVSGRHRSGSLLQGDSGGDAGPTKVVTAAYLHGLIMSALLCRERTRRRAASNGDAAGGDDAWTSDDDSEDDDAECSSESADIESAVKRAGRIASAGAAQQHGAASTSAAAVLSSPSTPSMSRAAPVAEGGAAATPTGAASALQSWLRRTGIVPRVAFFLGGEARVLGLLGFRRRQQRRKSDPDDED